VRGTSRRGELAQIEGSVNVYADDHRGTAERVLELVQKTLDSGSSKL
jgi:hypothetical protein